jgi:hypothetical protein
MGRGVRKKIKIMIKIKIKSKKHGLLMDRGCRVQGQKAGNQFSGGLSMKRGQGGAEND